MLTQTDIQYLVGLLSLAAQQESVELTLGDFVYDEATKSKRDVDVTITTKNPGRFALRFQTSRAIKPDYWGSAGTRQAQRRGAQGGRRWLSYSRIIVFRLSLQATISQYFIDGMIPESANPVHQP